MRNKLTMACVAFFVLLTPLMAKKKSEYLINIAKEFAPLTGTKPAHWRVTWTGDAARQATVSWSTAEQGTSHTVYYGLASQFEKSKKYKFKQKAQVNGKYPESIFYHHAKLENLKPGSKYYFAIKSDKERSRRFYFITAPATGTNFSIIVGGDSRSGHESRCKINKLISETISSNPKILGFGHGGDYILSGKNVESWMLWLSHHELTTGTDGRVIPMIATRGNHDKGPIYKMIFAIAEDQPDWHTVTMGKDVAVVTLDTNTRDEAQEPWLDGELKRLRPNVKWLITQYHRPFYPAVKSPGKDKKKFVPLFDKYNVDLACESDGHCIKRTMPIRADKLDPAGVVYIGEGGLGVGQYKPTADKPFLKGAAISRGHHFMVIGFTDKTLRIKTTLLDGSIFDDYTMKIKKK